MSEPQLLRFPDPTPANKARLAEIEAASEAGKHIDEMIAAIEAGQRFCEEVAHGGPSYPAGVKDFARVEQDRLAQRLAVVRGIVGRSAAR